MLSSVRACDRVRVSDCLRVCVRFGAHHKEEKVLKETMTYINKLNQILYKTDLWPCR